MLEALDAHGKWVRVVEIWLSGGARKDYGCRLDRQASRRNAKNSHRQQSESLLGRDSNRSDTEVRDVRVSQVPLTKAALDFVGYPREIRLKPASDTIYSYSQRSMTVRMHTRREITRRYGRRVPICWALPMIASLFLDPVRGSSLNLIRSGFLQCPPDGFAIILLR